MRGFHFSEMLKDANLGPAGISLFPCFLFCFLPCYGCCLPRIENVEKNECRVGGISVRNIMANCSSSGEMSAGGVEDEASGIMEGAADGVLVK